MHTFEHCKFLKNISKIYETISYSSIAYTLDQKQLARITGDLLQKAFQERLFK